MQTIYDLITKEEKSFLLEIPVTDSWNWSFAEHIKKSVHYKNSVFLGGKDDNRPFKNVIRPILNVQYRAEGFDVKDIVLFVDNAEKNWKSFLVRRYHDKWARENKLDKFIDALVESYVDFGGVLVKKTSNSVPEVVPLQRLAFVDQSDMLAGPICEKHFYSPTELREEGEGKKWENLDEVIAQAEKNRDVNGQKANTPGKHIEVYELHGVFPRHFLEEEYGEYYSEEQENDLVGQVHICTFYMNEDGTRKGISLFKGLEKDSPYKLLLRDEIYGRALGLGGVEELFEDQIWINYGMIRLKQLLDSASKVINWTDDPKFANNNKTDHLENGEILVGQTGTTFRQIDTTPRSTQLFDNFVANTEQHARVMGAASEGVQGQNPPAGTPFKLQELITAEAHSLHEYRKKKISDFVVEIYHDWILPQINKDIRKGEAFLAELELDELQFVTDRLINNLANKAIKEGIMKGILIPAEMIEEFKIRAREEFSKTNKKFLEILKDEFKDTEMDVKVDIAGKQKNLSGETDKLVNVYRTLVAQGTNPALLAKLLAKILEFSGLSPIDFAGLINQPVQPTPVSATEPLKKLPERPTVAGQISNQ